MTKEDKDPKEPSTAGIPEPKPAGEKSPGKKPAAAAGKLQKPGKKPPTRFQKFIRRAFWTLLIALLLFAAGMVTSYMLFQQPAVEELSLQVESLQESETELKSQVESLEQRVAELEPLEVENTGLQATLADEMLHVQILSSLKDVQSAHLSLALADTDSARLSLSRTADKLEALRDQLPVDQQGVVDELVDRLDLVLQGLETDAFAAQSDLSVLTNRLIQLENTLFTSP